MAPPTKPSVSKGTNPAPDFTVNMNRIQTQLQARLKAVRSFLPSRPDLQTSTSTSTGGSFSALSSSNPSSHPQPQATTAEARRAAAEAEFAEDRNLDPNVGIGLAPTSKNSDANGRDRDTARLRGRLLGKRGKNGEMVEKRWVRREESSDEEAGRSGLGRTKRGGKGKRSRAEMEGEDRVEGEVAGVALLEVGALDEEDGNGLVKPIDQAGDVEDDVENPTPKPTEAESSTPAEGNSEKRRKRKKKKSKNKTNEA
ncbi:uncharacterized protein GGS22DRAFT_146055 [Annulohypoxylon maeteangense]|uniref:uncharacterized protein n=1 Tax=Annulohypoxylon maeteangense TaxID=1927788 RepID=UPI0020080EBC|nr:uncharacterized protein GGS22DRAFT_146055 [Annulohypoxylon maeteangense]KAI0884707.1 hypothetical protein GGS22DRAFT_146055 [Annulohypoxylon maeteangense]